MIKFVKGNLLDHQGIIAHQVNCQGVMGAGLALQIRTRFPKAFYKYKDVASSKCLGRTQVVRVNDSQYVANVFGQDRYGRGERHTNYIALSNALKELRFKAHQRHLSVGIPLNMGCGLAGGDWETVLKIIEDNMYDIDVTIYSLGGF